MARRIMRWTLTGCAGALWGATVTTTLNDTHMKIYLTTAMATALVTACAIGVWILSADHLAAAVARNKIREVRLTKALWEEAEARDKQRYVRVRHESVAHDHN